MAGPHEKDGGTPPTRRAVARRPPRAGGGESESTVFDNARSLRTNATDAERILWTALRNFKRGGVHFRRQAPIGRYVVDFVCHRAKLIVELDGSQHGTDKAMAYDAERTAFLNSRGYRVMRFWNAEIFENLHGVCDAIFAIAKESSPHPARPMPRRPPRVGGGKR